jgi:hypothetical protein
MKKITIYILKPTQFFRSVTPMGNGYACYNYHGERELEPLIFFSMREARLKKRTLMQEYEAKGLKVIIATESFTTGKREFMEAIEKYRIEVGA